MHLCHSRTSPLENATRRNSSNVIANLHRAVDTQLSLKPAMHDCTVTASHLYTSRNTCNH